MDTNVKRYGSGKLGKYLGNMSFIMICPEKQDISARCYIPKKIISSYAQAIPFTAFVSGMLALETSNSKNLLLLRDFELR